jgi:predicted HicB family RNase H-like nuclease
MMPLLTVRVPDELLAAAEKRAEESGVKLSAYVRKLLANDTGIEIDEIKMGLAGADAKTIKRVQSAGTKAYVASTKARAKKPRAKVSDHSA